MWKKKTVRTGKEGERERKKRNVGRAEHLSPVFASLDKVFRESIITVLI